MGLKPQNIDLDALDWLLLHIPRCLFFIEFRWTVISMNDSLTATF